MATNIIKYPDAEEIKLYLRNTHWDDAITDQPNLTINIPPEVNTLVIKDETGNLIKMLKDASGESNTPAGLIFFSDSDGAADSSSDLEYDGTDVNIQGYPVHHAGRSEIGLSNNGHTATLSLSATGELTISLDGVIQEEIGGDYE